jgi:hypothetical protein
VSIGRGTTTSSGTGRTRKCACGDYFCAMAAETQRFSRKIALVE